MMRSPIFISFTVSRNVVPIILGSPRRWALDSVSAVLETAHGNASRLSSTVGIGVVKSGRPSGRPMYGAHNASWMKTAQNVALR